MHLQKFFSSCHILSHLKQLLSADHLFKTAPHECAQNLCNVELLTELKRIYYAGKGAMQLCHIKLSATLHLDWEKLSCHRCEHGKKLLEMFSVSQTTLSKLRRMSKFSICDKIALDSLHTDLYQFKSCKMLSNENEIGNFSLQFLNGCWLTSNFKMSLFDSKL